MIANIDFLLKEGFRIEAKAGIYLSTGYLVLWGLSARAHSQDGNPGTYIFAGMALFLIGVLPVALFGGITGMVIGEIFFWLKNQLPETLAALIGFISSAGVVLFLFRPQLIPPSSYYDSRYYSLDYWWRTNLFFPLLPGLIYILTSTWVAVRLNRLNAPPTPWPTPNVYVETWVIESIKANYLHFTRYAIDLNLIEAGVSGIEIECAWKLIEFEALERAKWKQLRQSLGVVRILGINFDLGFWATIPALIFLAGGLIFVLPFVVILPLVVMGQLIGAVYFRRCSPTFSAVLWGSIPVMLSLSYFA